MVEYNPYCAVGNFDVITNYDMTTGEVTAMSERLLPPNVGVQ